MWGKTEKEGAFEVGFSRISDFLRPVLGILYANWMICAFSHTAKELFHNFSL